MNTLSVNLSKYSKKEDNPVVQSLLTTYEISTQLIKVIRRLPPQSKGISVEKLIGEIASVGFQSERDQIQTMYETRAAIVGDR